MSDISDLSKFYLLNPESHNLCLVEVLVIPVCLSGALSKNLGTNDRLRAIHLWEDPTYLTQTWEREFTVAPSVEEFHLIPPGMVSIKNQRD